MKDRFEEMELLKVMEIKPEWIEWAKQQVKMLKDGAFMVFPEVGAVFQIDKNKKTLTAICEKSSFNGSVTQKINNQVFSLIGYKVIRPTNTSTNVDAFIDKLEKVSRPCGLAGIFKTNPLNPITLKGNPSLSIGRLWIQSKEIEFGQHVFAPLQKREKMDRTMTFVFWKNNVPEKPLDHMLISDERKFLEGIWMLDGAGFTLNGIRSKAEPVPSQIYFSKNEGKLIVVMNNITAKYDWDHVYRGLNHLFANGELINHLAN